MVLWWADERDVDAEQDSLLHRLANYRARGSHYHFLSKTPFESLKSLILSLLGPKPEERHHIRKRNGHPRVYVLCDRRDSDDTRQAWTLRKAIIEHEGFDVVLPETGPLDPRELREDHEQKLDSSDAVLLYWGHASREWFEENWDDVRLAPRLLRSEAYRSQAVYVTDPQEKKPLPDALVIPQSDQFRYGALDPFLAPLRVEGR
jgi:hypothetical protein